MDKQSQIPLEIPPALMVAFAVVLLLAVLSGSNNQAPQPDRSITISKIERVQEKEIVLRELKCSVSLPKGWTHLANSNSQSNSESEFISSGKVSVFLNTKKQTVIRLSPLLLQEWPPKLETDSGESAALSQELGTKQEELLHSTISWLVLPESSKDRANRQFGKLSVGDVNLMVTILEHRRVPDEALVREFLNAIQSLK